MIFVIIHCLKLLNYQITEDTQPVKRVGGELRRKTNRNLSEAFFPFRFKVLANQYKAIYPTLKIDIEGELEKLKVSLLLSLRLSNHHVQLLICKSLGVTDACARS